ncbi:hypothetical protein N7517_004915 [Penicillium concentricum]|uniref:Uncharacterized protein n=1 Tax=Penicillium concentricum TaxID=293559 RepID=A0A9W9V9U9_9EURO|nr:uncharacterized protein N7517_004915 [Penicillium concentricum]KAJ5372909.1 hypothetical protein N7517_004915 [Penicillium concentricum]
MIDAIRQDDTLFTTELLFHGLRLSPNYAMEAAKAKAKNVLETFFEKGWDSNNPISRAQPPVLWVSSFVAQDQDMTIWLLDRGANPNQRCDIDLTPLSYADRYASVSTIKLLLRRGNMQHAQLLFHAVERESETFEVLQLLLK